MSIDCDSQSFALFGHPINDIDLTAAAIVQVCIDLIATISTFELAKNIAQRDDIAFVAGFACFIRGERIALLRLRDSRHDRGRERNIDKEGDNFLHHDDDMIKML